ncbi:VID27 cytoplasmic protein-domain-containing protein [Suillus ampliporus]|nr:VID27 cytoplasmic protein-domain-containing protein [Suillus ampliporus]
MNIFKSLLGKVWRTFDLAGRHVRWPNITYHPGPSEDPNAAEVVKIEMGQLYLVRPGNIRSSRECIYNEAIATIRRVPALEHNFQLVITRVYEDGDQELLEDEDETDEERVFLISEELEFRSGVTDDEPTFIWRDLDGDVDELYEFVASGTNEPTRVFFETCMYRAMYERKYKASADNTKDSALDQFIWQPVTKARSQGGNRKSPNQLPVVLQDSVDNSTVQPPAMPTKSASPAARASFASSSLPTVTSQEGQLFFWSLEAEGFVAEREEVVVAKIVERTTGDFNYWFIVTGEDGDIVSHKISSDMNPRWAPKTSSLTWNYPNRGRYDSWALQLTSSEAYNAFKTAFAQCLWETLHGVPFRKAKPDEQAYVISSTTEDVEMRDVEDEVEDEDEVESELDPDEEASEDEEEEEEDGVPPQLQGERNSQLTVGYKGDRSYVVRGNNIGVFSHSRDDQVKYYATISNISTPKGKEFKPQEVMLHDQDTKMVLMNPSDPHSLFSMDIERGKVVEEWKIHEDISVDHIAPDNKFAQTTREQTLVGASHNALFRVDPRISGNKMVESQYKQYVSKNKFSGVATTASGKLAVASEKGDIRLFDTIGKNAKTALPPLGDPILGIDVTASGRWIVATTKTYLLLIDTLIGEGRYAGNLGFDRSFPANAKPMPRRLQLRSEHVAYMNHDISFSVARFNQGEGQEENAIVTATGQYVIAWDFAKVKKGQLDKYEIKKYEDMVVQDNFKFGDDKQIIVALQNNVLAINKKNLKRPTRVSLAAPMPSLRSRSSIVDSPY